MSLLGSVRRRSDRLRRAEHVLRWPLGLARVLWHRLPGGPSVHRSQVDGDARDLPPPVVQRWLDERVQLVADGRGPLLRRRYTIVVDGATHTPEEVMSRFGADPNCVVPEVAVFERTRGGPGPMQEGDEYTIKMPAPWDGPVRVIGTRTAAYRFATLDGHLEAGQIEFRADTVPGGLRFEIEAWARPGDLLSHLLYNRLLLAKEIQLTLWVQTCVRVAEVAGGRPRSGVAADTRVVAEDRMGEIPAGV